jgi:hypothetical protein
MREPKIPAHTCSMIDNLKNAIESAHELADDHKENTLEGALDLLRNIARELRGEADKLETLRDANLALRNAAEYWAEKASELKDEMAAQSYSDT